MIKQIIMMMFRQMRLMITAIKHLKMNLKVLKMILMDLMIKITIQILSIMKIIIKIIIIRDQDLSWSLKQMKIMMKMMKQLIKNIGQILIPKILQVMLMQSFKMIQRKKILILIQDQEQRQELKEVVLLITQTKRIAL